MHCILLLFQHKCNESRFLAGVSGTTKGLKYAYVDIGRDCPTCAASCFCPNNVLGFGGTFYVRVSARNLPVSLRTLSCETLDRLSELSFFSFLHSHRRVSFFATTFGFRISCLTFQFLQRKRKTRPSRQVMIGPDMKLFVTADLVGCKYTRAHVLGRCMQKL